MTAPTFTTRPATAGYTTLWGTTPQDAAYREGVLPGSVTAARDRRGRRILRVHDIAGRDGIIVGIDGFGVSATADQALVARGMTPARVLAAIDESVQLADR